MATSARVLGQLRRLNSSPGSAFFVEERHGSAFQRSLFSLGREVRRPLSSSTKDTRFYVWSHQASDSAFQKLSSSLKLRFKAGGWVDQAGGKWALLWERSGAPSPAEASR